MLPIVNFEPFLQGSEADRLAVAQDIAQACSEVGFLYIRNHGVPSEVIEAAKAAQRAFFARPMDEKLPYRRKTGQYRGYIAPMAFTETKGKPPTLYESFIVGDAYAADDPVAEESAGTVSPTPWPQDDEFTPAFKAYWAAVSQLADRLMQAYAMALGLPEDCFAKMMTRRMSNLSILHYLARDPDAHLGDDDARAHRDTNALTILLPGEVGGLEVKRKDGSFAEAPPEPGCFVVNTANMMEIWSGGRFRSTIHRVHPPVGVDRYSLAYFASPNPETEVRPLVDPVPGIDPKLIEPVEAGRDMARFIALFDRK